MNTMTLSFPYIKALKDRLNEGQHLNVLCILNQYAPHDPVMVTAMMRHLTAHALRHANDKMGLITRYHQTRSASLSEQEQQQLNHLLRAERVSMAKKRVRIVATPHRGRRPLPLVEKKAGESNQLRCRDDLGQRWKRARRQLIAAHETQRTIRK